MISPVPRLLLSTFTPSALKNWAPAFWKVMCKALTAIPREEMPSPVRVCSLSIRRMLPARSVPRWSPRPAAEEALMVRVVLGATWPCASTATLKFKPSTVKVAKPSPAPLASMMAESPVAASAPESPLTEAEEDSVIALKLNKPAELRGLTLPSELPLRLKLATADDAWAFRLPAAPSTVELAATLRTSTVLLVAALTCMLPPPNNAEEASTAALARELFRL